MIVQRFDCKMAIFGFYRGALKILVCGSFKGSLFLNIP